MIRSKPKPLRAPKTRKPRTKSRRKQLEAELEQIIRLIIAWRDTSTCIEANVDGGRCGGGIQWGHFTPRKQSGWMKFTLATFCQCRNHNALHDKGSQTMAFAVVSLLGPEWLARHESERDAHRGQKITEAELAERLERYKALWDNRPSVYDTKELERIGYYG